MTFANSEPQISAQEITSAEKVLGIVFPLSMRSFYLLSNGGIPEPYVYEDENIDTVVTEFLPIKSDRKKTAVETYERLILNKQLAAKQFFPFAVDGGGDYFFSDCSTQEGAVHFYRSDSAESKHLISLNLGFEMFWKSLKGES
jgi:hypothetical protein